MNFLHREITHQERPVSLRCSYSFWFRLMRQLRYRGHGEHESGAFLLGRRGHICTISKVVYYDDLDPKALSTGIICFDGQHYGELWKVCRQTGFDVLADVHTHPGSALQSQSDRAHPMMAVSGHVALIVPEFAAHWLNLDRVKAYQYRGNHEWTTLGTPQLSWFLNIEIRSN